MDSEIAQMTFPKARLAVSACLFVGWLVFLFVLWLRSSAVILSKPQFMAAQAFVVVEVRDRNGIADAEVSVAEVLWSSGQLTEKTLHLPDLSACSKAHGYQGAGKYLLPLASVDGRLEIAPVPHIWGYPHAPPTHGTVEAPGLFSHRLARRLPLADAVKLENEWKEAGYKVSFEYEEIRIYPWTPDTRAQVESLIAAKK